jgi:hypothetical protein
MKNDAFRANDRTLPTVRERAEFIDGQRVRVENGFEWPDDTDRTDVERALDPVQGFTRGDRLVIVAAALSALAPLVVVVGLFALLCL